MTSYTKTVGLMVLQYKWVHAGFILSTVCAMGACHYVLVNVTMLCCGHDMRVYMVVARSLHHGSYPSSISAALGAGCCEYLFTWTKPSRKVLPMLGVFVCIHVPIYPYIYVYIRNSLDAGDCDSEKMLAVTQRTESTPKGHSQTLGSKQASERIETSSLIMQV